MRISQSSYRLGIVVVTLVLVWQCSNSSPSAPTTTQPLVEDGFQVNVGCVRQVVQFQIHG